MLRQQADGIPIGVGVTLRQIFHGFNEQLLAFDIALVANAGRASSFGDRKHRDGEYSGHIKSFMNLGWTDNESRKPKSSSSVASIGGLLL